MLPGGVNATRMELLRLRRRLALARRGHHLLKGKQDELLRRFLRLLEDYMRAREELEELMRELSSRSREAQAEAQADTLRTAAWPPPPPAELEERSTQILNLAVPVREAHVPGRPASYGPTQLPSSYDDLILLWRKSLPRMVSLSNVEVALLSLSDEIERTRRRVNALEYKLIPGLEDGIRTIAFRLAEVELGNLTRLMRVKEIVRGS